MSGILEKGQREIAIRLVGTSGLKPGYWERAVVRAVRKNGCLGWQMGLSLTRSPVARGVPVMGAGWGSESSSWKSEVSQGSYWHWDCLSLQGWSLLGISHIDNVGGFSYPRELFVQHPKCFKVFNRRHPCPGFGFYILSHPKMSCSQSVFLDPLHYYFF